MTNDDLIKDFDGDKLTNLRLSLNKVENVIVVTVTGQLDTYNSDYFMAQIQKIFDGGYKNIVFLNGQLNYVSSTGVGAFANLLKMARLRAGGIALVNTMPKVMDIFNLLGFSTFFDMPPSTDAAIALLTKKPIGIFPMTFVCPTCRLRLRAQKQGRYRCSGCKVILTIDTSGTVSI